eukprot:240885-Rhodomonas_salina.1
MTLRGVRAARGDGASAHPPLRCLAVTLQTRHTQTQTQTHRHTDTETETETQRHRDRHSDTGT